MATLLATSLETLEHVDAGRDEPHPPSRDRKSIEAIVAAAFTPVQATASGRATAQRAREINWVCEWWPPE